MLAKVETDVVLGGAIMFPVLLARGIRGLCTSQVRVVDKENPRTIRNFTFYKGEVGERERKTPETTEHATLTQDGGILLNADTAWIRD